MDIKRTIYLFLLATAIGLVLVFLRTTHVHAVYNAASLQQQQQQLHRQIWARQADMCRSLRSPQHIKDSLQRLGIDLCPPQDVNNIDKQIDKQIAKQ